MHHRLPSLLRASALVGALSVAGGCMTLSPQLRPTDFEKLETLSDRSERAQAYADNSIVAFDEPQGTRYTKGTDAMATKRSWQSLDAILRSDASASASLPNREMRISRLFTALTVVAGILTVAGTAASAREGLDLGELNGTGAVLLSGGLASVGFGITAGVFYGKTKKGYQNAINIYNDSLAVRLGLNTPSGEYIPPEGVLVDEEGFIVLDEREVVVEETRPEDAPEDAAAPAEVGPVEAPALPEEAAAPDVAPAPEASSPEETPAPEVPAAEAPAEPPASTVPVQRPTGSGGGTAAPPAPEEGLTLHPRG